jgi:hypothetical protein
MDDDARPEGWLRVGIWGFGGVILARDASKGPKLQVQDRLGFHAGPQVDGAV